MAKASRRGIDEEFAFHLDRLVDHLMAKGMTRADAERHARERFGNPARYRLEVWSLDRPTTNTTNRWDRMLTVLRQDLRYAVRSLRKVPGFTLVVIVTLALGIGANTAIFSVVHGVLVRPLGLRDPDRLVAVVERNPETGARDSPTSVGTLIDWRDGTESLAGIAAFTWASITLEDPVESVELQGVYVTGNYFTTLGVDPLIGRLIQPDDAIAAAGSVVVISSALWRERFGARLGVLGETITLDGTPATIVGVMRTGVPAPGPDVDLWMPVAFTNDAYTNRGLRVWHAVGRLAPDAAVG